MFWRPWYYDDYACRLLPTELKDFLSEYTNEQFRNDFALLFPELAYGDRPVRISEAAHMMYRIADGVRT